MTGLIGWWPLHETNGDTAHDLSGNGNHASLLDTAHQGAIGRSGISGYYFDGNNSYLKSEWGGPKESFSISVWVRPSSITDREYIVAQHHQSGEYRWLFNLERDDENDDNLFRVFIRSVDPDESVSPEYVLKDREDTWIHLTSTFDNKTGTANLYVDGELVRSETNRSIDYDEQSPLDFTIGRRSSDDDRHFHGTISNLRAYNRVLSPSEIQELYNQGSIDLHKKSLSDGSDSGAVSRWKLEDGGSDGSTAVDSWSDNDGSIEGASFTDNSVRNDGRALQFSNDADDYVNCGDFSGTFISDPSINGEITFSAWFKRFGNSTSYILSSGSQTSSTGIHFRQDTVGVQTKKKTWGYTYGDSPLNVWVHYVATWDGKKLYAYKNGSLQAVVSSSSESEEDEESLLTIGAPNNSLDSDHNMNGIIDDVRVFDRALSSWEVFELYRWGSLGKDMRKELVNAKGGGQ